MFGVKDWAMAAIALYEDIMQVRTIARGSQGLPYVGDAVCRGIWKFPRTLPGFQRESEALSDSFAI